MENNVRNMEQGDLAAAAMAGGGWRLGLTLFGIFFMYRGLVMAVGMIKYMRVFPVAAIVSIFYLLCGAGLIMHRRWARILTLLCTPLFVLNALFVIHFIPRAGHTGPLIVIIVATAVFLYLLLPPVARQFPAVLGRIGRKRDMLAAPPRPVPLTLKLSAIFGNRFFILSWCIPAFVFFGIGNKLREYGLKFVDGYTAVWGGTFVFFALLMALVSWKVARWVMDSDLKLLENGILSQAVLKTKKLVNAKHQVYRLIFEFKVGERTFHTWLDTSSIKSLTDEASEPVLYDLKDPKNSMLLDDLPANVDIGTDGHFIHRYSFMGYVYPCIPLGILVLMTWMMLKK